MVLGLFGSNSFVRMGAMPEPSQGDWIIQAQGSPALAGLPWESVRDSPNTESVASFPHQPASRVSSSGLIQPFQGKTRFGTRSQGRSFLATLG